MSTGEHLRELLRPLGVYDLDAPFISGELDAQGAAVDGVGARLEEVQREASLVTAESWGVELLAKLFARRPVASEPRALAEALAALLRIGGDSFTLSAINNTISGCGIPAVAEEVGVAQVRVSFPGVVGEPEGFLELKKIIEDILPAHLAIEYVFWYLTWTELERKFASWQSIEDRTLSWLGLETCVD